LLAAARSQGFNRRDGHSEDFMALLHEIRQPILGDKFGFDQKLHPKKAFVGLLLDNPKLGDNVS